MKNAGYIDPSLLENLHGQFREETLIWYDEQSKLGDESFIERYRHNFLSSSTSNLLFTSKGILPNV